MNWVEERERPNGVFGRGIAAAWQYGRNWRVHWLRRGQTPAETSSYFRQVSFARIQQVRANLQITRILARFALDFSRTRGRNKKAGLAIVRDVADEGLHWRCELVERYRVL